MSSDEKRTLRVLYLQPGTTVFAGVERVVDMVCTELAINHRDNFAVDVLRISQHDCYPPEPRRYNSLMRPAKSLLAQIRTYRSVVRKGRYDLAIIPQIEPTVLFWFSRLGVRQRVVLHLHGNPGRECGHYKAKIMFFLMRHVVLRRLAAVFGTSPQQLRKFKDSFDCRRPMFWVPNPIREIDQTSHDRDHDAGLIKFVNVGRYDYQKGQDILVDAFAKLYAERKDVRLSLVGHGHGKDALVKQIEALGLTNVVRLEHHPDNPQQSLLSSDVFVATSRWEGWSLAICEALRCGLPVISIDCEFGPSDILVDRRLGRLVAPDDEESLVEAMRYYCDNRTKERTFSEFRKQYIDQYSVEKVTKVHADAMRQASH